MSYRVIAALALSMSLCAFGSAKGGPQILSAGDTQAASEEGWSHSWEEARKQAAKENKLMLVDFYTDWCGWCKRMDADTFTKPEIKELLKTFVPVKVNAEKERTVAATYRVRSYPNFGIIAADGTAVKFLPGYKPAPAFKEAVEKALKEEEALIAAITASSKGAATPEQLMLLGQRHLTEGRLPQALVSFQKVADRDLDNATGLTDDALTMIGRIHFAQRQLDQAETTFRKVHDRWPAGNSHPDALVGLAKCLVGQGKESEALQYYEAYIRQYPSGEHFSGMNAEYDGIRKRLTGNAAN